MSDPRRMAEHAWKDAEALVDRLEQASRSEMPGQSFYRELTSGLMHSSGALATTLWLAEVDRQAGSDRCEVLSTCGLAKHLDDADCVATQMHDATHSPTTDWHDPNSDDSDTPRHHRMTTIQKIHSQAELGSTVIGITSAFEGPVSPSIRQPLTELAEAVLDLAARVFVKQQYETLRHQLADQTSRDEIVCQLHDGIGLSESFAAIAAAIASTTAADRVSLLKLESSGYRLIASSTQMNVDRRARQVRLLERLTDTALDRADQLSFTVGDPSEVDEQSMESLEAYLTESGCRELHMVSVLSDRDESTTVASIVLERFRVMRDDERSLARSLESIDRAGNDAINKSIHRNAVGWDLIVSRLSEGSRLRKVAVGTIGAVIAATVLALVPVSFKVPAEGRVLATQRTRIFAPADGNVIQLPLRNGQAVRKGDPIIVLRSDKLDADQKQLEGELATARTRLTSLSASRSRSIPDRRDNTLSADEQVLKTQIGGLEEQLQLVERQQAKLTLTSPIDGNVDRWNLQQSLASRPVQRGQYLVDVYSRTEGWSIELEIPDKNIGYVIAAQQNDPCRCTFRLRSNPEIVHEGTVQQIAEVAHVSAAGRSVVRVTFPYAASDAAAFRVGSTVNAQVHAGKRSLGFVWFRGLVEWFRTRTWI